MARYDAKMVAQAERLYRSGWTPSEIRKILAHEFGLERPPVLETIKVWVDPEYRQWRRTTDTRAKRDQRRREGVTWLPQMATADTKLYRMEALSEIGMSCRAISALMKLDYGLDIGEYAVRRYLVDGATPRCLLGDLKAA